MPTYLLQCVHRDSGEDSTITVESSDREAALAKANAMGFLVGRVEPVVPPLPELRPMMPISHGMGNSYSQSPSPMQAVNVFVQTGGGGGEVADPGRTLSTTALVLAYSGLLIGPLGVVGAICGGVAMSKSSGKYGLHALIAGIVTAFLWILVLQSL